MTISGGTLNYHSDIIDISCAASVNISFDIETTSGSLESDQDYLFFSFRVDSGTLQGEIEKWGNVNLEHIDIPDVSGSTLEMFIEGYTSAGSEVYRVSNIIVEDASDSNVAVTAVTMHDCPSGPLIEGAIIQL